MLEKLKNELNKVLKMTPELIPNPTLAGAHHTARPTWKLRETIEFYRDKLGLPLVHAISARGWPEGHPDFLHFFFDSGQGSTIAFFYYIGTERPEYLEPRKSHFYSATHTAWRVENAAELEVWRQRLEAMGVPMQPKIRHEVIESLYMLDPNGYMVEISYQLRPFTELDVNDAHRTLEAAMQLEDELKTTGNSQVFNSIDAVWRKKGQGIQQAFHELDKVNP
jgi:catechol 2,3-dioxygenase-like lactoylglutathione lyase family enzyme